MKIFIAVHCLLLSCCAFAQQSEAIGELKKIKSYYEGTELKHAEGQMILKNAATSKQIDKVAFEYWAKGEEVFTRMNYIEILNNKNFYIMINNKRNTIYARTQSSIIQKPSVGLFDPEQLKLLLNTKGAIITVSKNSNINQLTMSGLKNTKFSSLTISYSPIDYKIIGVNATINENPENNEKLLLEIKYNLTEKTIPSTEVTMFSSAKYITDTKGNLSFTKAYQNYQKL